MKTKLISIDNIVGVFNSDLESECSKYINSFHDNFEIKRIKFVEEKNDGLSRIYEIQYYAPNTNI